MIQAQRLDIYTSTTKMKIAFRTQSQPAGDGAIQAAETMLGFRLPEEYRCFISERNGGSVDFANKYIYRLPEEYPDPPLVLEGFFRVEELPDKYARVREAFGVELLPVGIDDFGNYISLRVRNEPRGAVYFVDHELIDEKTGEPLVLQIADGFAALLASLTGDQDQEG